MLKKNVLANYLGQAWAAIMAIAFVPVYIKYLGIESYGLIGLFSVLQAWLILLDMGMTPTMSREMARFTGGTHSAQSIRNLLRSIEIIVFTIAIIIAGAIVLSSDWIATSWLNTQELPVSVVVNAFIVMGMVASLRFVEGIYISSLNGLQRQVTLNILRVIFSTLRGLGSVLVLAWISPTISAFFIWQGFLAILSLFCHAWMTYVVLPVAGKPAVFSTEEVKKIIRYAGGMLGITFLSLLLTQADKILLSSLLPLTEYGYYSFAAVVAGIIFMIVSPITGAWFPRLSQLYAQGDDTGLIKTFHLGAQLVSVIAGSASLVIIFNSETIISLWTRDPDLAQQTSLIFSLLVAGNFLNCLMWIPYQAQLAHGWTSLAARINLAAVLVVVPAIIWVAPRYGGVGTAYVWIALNLAYNLIGVQFMYMKILKSEKWRWYISDIVQPVAVAAIVLALFTWVLPEPKSLLSQFSILFLISLITLVGSALGATQVRQQLLVIATLFFPIQKVLHEPEH